MGPTNNPCQCWKANIITDVSLSQKPIKTLIYKDNDCVHTVVFIK